MAAEEANSSKVNINTATIEELTSLKGIGPTLAGRIVDYREMKGRFESLEELKLVSGIGKKLFAGIKDEITNEIQEVNLKQLDEDKEVPSSDEVVEDKKKEFELNEGIDIVNEYQVPQKYGVNELVLQVKNPKTAHLYWEYTEDKINEVIAQTGIDDINEAKLSLRVHNVTADSEYDIEIGLENDSWWLNELETTNSYFVNLGVVDGEGNFHSILQSNKITMPTNKVSDRLDEEWMTLKETMEQVYLLSGGLLFEERESGYSSVDILKKLESNNEIYDLDQIYSSIELLKGTLK
ncbi:hypothetical protein U472_02280 [Orenia metallireducens]|uniref:Helix-hairpin-helix DNA-binding motif class 1 domain-containing protein n=1 Tax=Orenia metallireducens TaxID=1413210 RepID=A0A1C0ACF4_9FIRM|nr:DUF4912 domain-containing protein [Orenia metallireducens]OCL28047.1 hypothetical protein U472_02280 [Orenia metallireducens]